VWRKGAVVTGGTWTERDDWDLRHFADVEIPRQAVTDDVVSLFQDEDEYPWGPS
jgi:hypothetical protein